MSIDYLPPEYAITSDPIIKERSRMNCWAWDSHKYKEVNRGYYVCEFCKGQWTSVMGISSEHEPEVYLCKSNPVVKRLFGAAAGKGEV